MPHQVFLHIGPPKTGTSFIQQILWSNTELLDRAGIGMPFKNAWCHRFVSRTLRGDPQWTHRRGSRQFSWERFVEYVAASDRSVLLSTEDLASALPEHVAHAIDTLSPATVHVISTARDLGRQLPSAWQNSVKNGRVLTLDEYVEKARNAHPSFWRSQDVPAVLGRWLEHLPAERVHLVTVPKRPESAGLLWTRFADVVGVEADAAELPPSMSNVSLGAVQAEVLRKVYLGLGTDLPERLSHYRAVRSVLLPALFASTDRTPIRLRPEQQRWLVERADRMRRELQQLGIDMRGAWDDLVPDESATSEDAVTLAEEMDVAVDALRRLTLRSEPIRVEEAGAAHLTRRTLRALRRTARVRRLVARS